MSSFGRPFAKTSSASWAIADSEAWDVGLPCGGEIDVFVEEYSE